MIRVPKDFHVPKHWHTANETHTIVSGTFIMQHEGGQREELGPGSFNYVPSKAVHQAWTKPGEGTLLFITGWCVGCELGRGSAPAPGQIARVTGPIDARAGDPTATAPGRPRPSGSGVRFLRRPGLV